MNFNYGQQGGASAPSQNSYSGILGGLKMNQAPRPPAAPAPRLGFGQMPTNGGSGSAVGQAPNSGFSGAASGQPPSTHPPVYWGPEPIPQMPQGRADQPRPSLPPNSPPGHPPFYWGPEPIPTQPPQFGGSPHPQPPYAMPPTGATGQMSGQAGGGYSGAMQGMAGQPGFSGQMQGTAGQYPNLPQLPQFGQQGQMSGQAGSGQMNQQVPFSGSMTGQVPFSGSATQPPPTTMPRYRVGG